jgi:hypothetical protein
MINWGILKLFYKKKQWRPPSKKKKKGGKNLSPRNWGISKLFFPSFAGGYNCFICIN